MNFSSKDINLSMELEVVIGTIRKGIKRTNMYYLNAYIDLQYQLSGKS